jgi:hypothetical protein
LPNRLFIRAVHSGFLSGVNPRLQQETHVKHVCTVEGGHLDWAEDLDGHVGDKVDHENHLGGTRGTIYNRGAL